MRQQHVRCTVPADAIKLRQYRGLCELRSWNSGLIAKCHLHFVSMQLSGIVCELRCVSKLQQLLFADYGFAAKV